MHFNLHAAKNCQGVRLGKDKQLLNFYFMQKFNKLSKAEMKSVLGGLLPGGGEGCYNCFVNYPDGTSISGPSCGSSFQNAGENLTTNILNHPGTYGSPSYWGCNETPYVS